MIRHGKKFVQCFLKVSAINESPSCFWDCLNLINQSSIPTSQMNIYIHKNEEQLGPALHYPLGEVDSTL